MDRRRAGGLAAFLALVLAIAIGALIVTNAGAGHGHVIERRLAPNHDMDFDFMKPPCERAARPAARKHDVLIRYLGISGLYIEWKGTGLMTAPFFSNYGLVRAGLGDVGWDREAIRRGLEGIELNRVRAVFSGHGHYDHLVDLPPILLEDAPGARVWVNRSSANMLWAFEELRDRTETLNGRLGRWIRLSAEDGTPLPVRFMALESSHAPHVQGLHWSDGRVDRPWASWEKRKVRAMRQGLPLAFVIDLLADDGESIAFRIWFQDAVAEPPAGLPPDEVVAERDVDLAVLGIASFWRVARYPEGVVEQIRPRHVLATHYEDFFQPADEPLRFVSFLTDKRANEFLERLDRALSASSPRGPVSSPCGPGSPAYTMPLPGEWLRFSTRED